MVKALINQFAENTYIVVEKKEAVIIDPGASLEEIKEYITTNDLTLKYVLLTHGHVDHIICVNDLIAEYDIDVYIHELERDFLFDPNLNLSGTMYQKIIVQSKKNVKSFKDGSIFMLGDKEIVVLHTPGHTRGSSCFSYKRVVFVGDTIFTDGVGRTDLPTGSNVKLEESINKLLNHYGDNTILNSGHGKHTTVLTQKNRNPYYHG